jgi:hypothetical protein
VELSKNRVNFKPNLWDDQNTTTLYEYTRGKGVNKIHLLALKKVWILCFGKICSALLEEEEEEEGWLMFPF